MTRWLIVLVIACSGNDIAPVAPVQPPPEKTLQVNKPGEPVDLDAMLTPGFVTVVDFWGEHCGACKVVSGHLAVGVALQDLVLIRKIDVGDGFTQVAKDHDIGALPHFRVYDKQKRLRYVLVGNDCLKAPQLARELAAEP